MNKTRFEVRQEQEEDARWGRLQKTAEYIGSKDAQYNTSGVGFSGKLMPSEELKLREAQKAMRQMIERGQKRAEQYKKYKDKGMKPYKS